MSVAHRAALTRLTLVGGCSLVLISGLDSWCYRLLADAEPAWQLLPEVRLSSLLVSATLCWWLGRDSLRGPIRTTPWRRIALLGGGWLLGCTIALFGLHVWTPALPRAVDMISFLGTGLLAEELLFRGAVFSAAESVFPASAGRLPLAAIFMSAALFAAQHLGYHGWRLSAPALTQVAYTAAFGVLLGLLRTWSGTLWIPALVHLANNLMTVLYRHVR